MVCLLIVCTLYWLCGVFIYGSVASSRCDFNASLGNASMLSNVGFDGPPTIYTVGLITVWGIIYYIEWLSSIHQWRGDVDEDVWLVYLSKRVHRSHHTHTHTHTQKHKAFLHSSVTWRCGKRCLISSSEQKGSSVPSHTHTNIYIYIYIYIYVCVCVCVCVCRGLS